LKNISIQVILKISITYALRVTLSLSKYDIVYAIYIILTLHIKKLTFNYDKKNRNHGG